MLIVIGIMMLMMMNVDSYSDRYDGKEEEDMVMIIVLFYNYDYFRV